MMKTKRLLMNIGAGIVMIGSCFIAYQRISEAVKGIDDYKRGYQKGFEEGQEMQKEVDIKIIEYQRDKINEMQKDEQDSNDFYTRLSSNLFLF